MSTQPQPNAWQNRQRPSQSANRTPQSRSGTASPSQQNTSQQPSNRQDAGRPSQTSNVWAERSRSASGVTGGSNGRPVEGVSSGVQSEDHTPVNGFNAAEVRDFLKREPAPPVYKPVESANARQGPAWGSKANHMANGQPFFVQLSKQVAALEATR